jgi:hypothetical protein
MLIKVSSRLAGGLDFFCIKTSPVAKAGQKLSGGLNFGFWQEGT